jgi:hypothetical protein
MCDHHSEQRVSWRTVKLAGQQQQQQQQQASQQAFQFTSLSPVAKVRSCGVTNTAQHDTAQHNNSTRTAQHRNCAGAAGLHTGVVQCFLSLLWQNTTHCCLHPERFQTYHSYAMQRDTAHPHTTQHNTAQYMLV